MKLTLQRGPRKPTCFQGVVTVDEAELVLQSLELSWVPADGFPGGMPNKSCVPAGVYDLMLHDSPKHPHTFALSNPALGVIAEPDPAHPNFRTDCLLHSAAFPDQLEGCIGVGISAGDCCINNGFAALAQLNAAVPWVEGHTLTIIDPP